MNKNLRVSMKEAKKAALEVLLHNFQQGSYQGLPRTAGWGYPEPYTRDLMIASLGVLTTGNTVLTNSLKQTLEALAKNQSRLGHITSLAHDPGNRGSSDTTPLFLIALALFRSTTGDTNFLEEAAEKSLRWMEYQSPSDSVVVAQQPTTDWRDEQWVMGYGLYVNVLVYTYLRLFEHNERADKLRELINKSFAVRHKPYYALCCGVIKSERFDLLGNSLAILSGIASPSRAKNIVSWIETECKFMRKKGELVLKLPPCLFPYIKPTDKEWRTRYEDFNLPGEYHNGGVWPFICGFYVAALVAAKRYHLAETNMEYLTELVCPANKHKVSFGFNEWFKADDGKPHGQDWQTWSVAMYIYASTCIEKRKTPFFGTVRLIN